MNKICKTCQEEKDITEFHSNPTMRDKRYSSCKTCTNAKKKEYRDQNLEEHREKYKQWKEKDPDKYYRMLRNSKLKKYGLTLHQYEEIFEAQGGLCTICNKPETQGTGGNNGTLAVDHCHATGLFRGLLCSSCNRGLGFFDDNPLYLQKAIEYLNENSSRLRNGLEAQ